MEVLNEGLPRAAWVVIGNAASRTITERLRLAHTLIVFQALLGLLMSIGFLFAAESITDIFVPSDIRHISVTYVRISGFSALSSALETAGSVATRTLDKPDVPVLISSTKFVINIILDMIFISTFHVASVTPTVNSQASIRLACDLSSAAIGTAYFIYTSTLKQKTSLRKVLPAWKALHSLARPGLLTMLESAVRNTLYFWLVSGIVQMV